MWDPKLSGQNVSVLESGERQQFADHLYKNKELETNQGQDSGFLSGPQTYSSSQIDVDEDHIESASSLEKLSTKVLSSEQDSFIDSGAICDISNNLSSNQSNKSSGNMILQNMQCSSDEWVCKMSRISLKEQPINDLGVKERRAVNDIWKLIYNWDEEGDT